MGYPPPLDGPPPGQGNVDVGFEPSPTGQEICGFNLTPPTLAFSFQIPGFNFMIDLPQLTYGVALNCDASAPLSATFGWGGGRKPTGEPDPDTEYR